MNGPKHYLAAERLLHAARHSSDATDIHAYQLRAQVHATLALTAAVARPPHTDGGVDDSDAWAKVCGVL